MKRLLKIQRPIAACFLAVFTVNMLMPVAGYALTTGPTQPEMKGFEPAGTANLVDPFSGDLTYNIPLMDVGGYPLNIAYHSGSGMDDESSWVGFGWSLNPGVIDRQMRGLPDDFNGDKVQKEFHMRNDITGGLNFGIQPELFGFNTGSFGLGLQTGIFYNNKRGIGVEFGLNADAPLLSGGKNAAGSNTAGLSASASLSLNSQEGASFNPSINFTIAGKTLNDDEKNMAKLGLGASINSRAGLQYTTLGASYNRVRTEGREKKEITDVNMSYTSYAAQTFLPETQANFLNESYSISPQFGGEIWGFHPGAQLTGHYSIQKVANPFSSYNAYGFLHSNEGKSDGNALMDFNREKDIPYFDNVPNLPVPVATPDLFMAHAQDGSGQYRAYPGGTGIFFDHDASNTGVNGSISVEVGAGTGFKVGGDLHASVSKTTTGKWTTGDKFLYSDANAYDHFGNFTGLADAANPDYEPAYFKRVGEQLPADGSVYKQVNGNIPVRIKTKGNTGGASAESILKGKDNSETAIRSNIMRDKRQARNNTFSYLSSEQAKTAGLDRQIADYYLSAPGFKPLLNKCASNLVPVSQPYKQDHHIGEITITDEGGARKIYGIPAYNTYQEDVSFSVQEDKGNTADRAKGLVSYDPLQDASINNNKGIDHFYSKEKIPGYAHSFLLTGVLSPDYVDLTNNGITDDDLGTAVKLNYWRKTDNFKWRTPYAAGMANYNEGLKSDKMDDRASYSYGTKELWYTHSIESKTMVAVFETGDRFDAMGADATGARDENGPRQQYLKTIKLYSKADWYRDAANALPIKTVHFVYDYSLFADPADISKSIPNNSRQQVNAGDPNDPNAKNILANQGGKLTLKKIYFTYQGNTKGELQPYEFVYDFNKTYELRQYDRWGAYKNETDGNPAGVGNDYYPYSCQDKTKADANAALWQLTKIITPAGGTINIQYESDDYMYVQNRKAMQMYPMAGVGDELAKNSGYYRTDKIYVQLPETLTDDAMLQAKYFDNGVNDYSRNLFFKALVKLKTNPDKYDYVAGYAEIANIKTDVKLVSNHHDVAEITVKKVSGEGINTAEYHPIAKAAWQFMRLNTPSLVYPGYNVSESAPPLQFIQALMGALSSIKELMAPFDTRAEINKLAPSIDLSKSWVRLDASTNDSKKINGVPYYGKLGGGSRVKEISMSDEWNDLAGAAAATYGMVYDYTTTLQLGNGITPVIASSGVASYEPMIGNEENPLHQPNKYQQNIKLGPDNAYFIDDPLCESYYPGASVGYSKVTMRNKGADGQVGATGYTVSEFYTEKDYPTVVDHTPIDAQHFGGASILQMLNIKKNNSRVVSQGYSIELNDMQGKPRSEKVVGKGGDEISSAYYYYKTQNADAPEKRLNNEAMVLKEDGTVSNTVIGRDMEMYSDMRSQTTFTAGVNVMVNIDAIYLLFAVVPIPNILPLPNAQYTGFRSASTVKVIQQYGILDKVIKRQNGSQITTENIAWDASTGEVLLTRSQNEFDDPVYNLNYPSHWSYDRGMGPAYKNLGLVLSNFSASNGSIANSAASALLVSGDELLVKNSGNQSAKYWVNNVGTATAPQLALIDADGNPVSVSGNATVVRSGRRNMHSMAIGAVVSMANPIRSGRLDIGSFTRVLDASGTVFNDEWAIEAKNKMRVVKDCPDGYSSFDENTCYKIISVPTQPTYQYNTIAARIKNSSYSTCGTIVSSSLSQWNTVNAADPSIFSFPLRTNTQLWKNPGSGCSTNGQTGDYDGPLNRSAIWPVDHTISDNYTNNAEWIGIKTKFYLSSSDVNSSFITNGIARLFIGFGADNVIEVYIDGILKAARNQFNDNTTNSAFSSWRVKPIDVAVNQQHEILVRVQNRKNNNAASEGAVGVEIYNNSFNDLISPNASASCLTESCLPCSYCSACRTASTLVDPCQNNPRVNIIWSTKCLAGQRFNYHVNSSGVLSDFDPIVCQNKIDDGCSIQCSVPQTVYTPKVTHILCDDPVNAPINPYTTGLRGNWRLQKTYAYHTDRNAALPYINPNDAPVPEKTDIRKSGMYEVFNPFWKYETNQWKSQDQMAVPDVNWVKANEVTVFNQKGQESENVDALNRYSSAQFGYLQSVATAVASNARYADIGYDGFEDYNFSLDNCNATDICNLDRNFDARGLCHTYPASIMPDASYAHSGRYSLKVMNGADASITRSLIPTAGNSLYTFNNKTMLLGGKGRLDGFKPQRNKRYLLSAWVRDNGNVRELATDVNKVGLDVSIAGQPVFYAVKSGPRVEKWCKVEVVFTIPATATDINIKFNSGGGTAWFDDVRIHPFDAQMKTYAYDDRSMRLWAELDENNFASFYEYDDEGILIRVKKETERGIMTIKETRSTYKMQKAQ